MNIDRVRVKGLFDRFDHDLAFPRDQRVMILTSPNGFGKTTTLNLIHALFNHSPARLTRMPFREIAVAFDDGRALVATNGLDQESQRGARLRLTLRSQSGETVEEHAHFPIRTRHLPFPLAAIDDFIPALNRVGPRSWHDTETGALHALDDVIHRFSHDLPPELHRLPSAPPDWVHTIQRSVAVRMLDTERLTLNEHYTSAHRRWGPHRAPNTTRTVSVCSADLAKRIRESAAEYGRLSQSLDRTFPARLGVFDDLYEKVNTFSRIVNSRFLHKHLTVSGSGFTVVMEDDKNLELEKLSSGEQHELVMLYELLFHASANSLFLIDEPERSLHVDWQENWLADLEDAAKLSGFRAIVATHSPEIIGERWCLTVELHGPNGG